jgi:hypothetical protein
MQECCPCGSVRGALGNQRPYRDTWRLAGYTGLGNLRQSIASSHQEMASSSAVHGTSWLLNHFGLPDLRSCALECCLTLPLNVGVCLCV